MGKSSPAALRMAVSTSRSRRRRPARAATEAIPALVGDAREELVNEIAVPGLKLYAVETGCTGAGGGAAAGGDEALDLGASESADGAAVGQGGGRGADELLAVTAL